MFSSLSNGIESKSISIDTLDELLILDKSFLAQLQFSNQVMLDMLSQNYKNLFITPHLGGSTIEGRSKRSEFTSKLILDWAKSSTSNENT